DDAGGRKARSAGARARGQSLRHQARGRAHARPAPRRSRRRVGAGDGAMIRVLVVEDSRFMRGVINTILSRDPDIEIVGSAADGLEAVDAVSALRPDVVTMDVDMPRADGLSAVERIMSEIGRASCRGRG